jgi:hypothetical protein
VWVVDCYWYQRHCVSAPHTDWKYQAFQVAWNGHVFCAIAFGMGSIKASFAMKSCACASVLFLARTIFCFAQRRKSCPPY